MNKRIRVETIDSNNTTTNLNIDLSNRSGDELNYLEGRSPNNNEISISYLNADKLNKKVGDELLIITEDKEIILIISGIYQDITSGGYTAKSKLDLASEDAVKYSFFIILNNDNQVEVANNLQITLGREITVDPMDEFIDQTLGGITNELKKAVVSGFVIGVVLVALILTLFLRLRIIEDLSDIGVLRSIGFKLKDIKVQYIIKILLITLLALIIGILLGNILG